MEPIKLKDALEERYLAYALSTIMLALAARCARRAEARASARCSTPCASSSSTPTRASRNARASSATSSASTTRMATVAVYDALVRLAQDFAQRYPLVDGQGNFGNIDGDNAAAMRYTEARLTAVAAALLDGIDEDTVDFRATYDGEEDEPVVLPAAFPNLLANGSTGIAVGMATSIPPHNAGETVRRAAPPDQASRARDRRRWSSCMPGPDFPTGGVLVETRSRSSRPTRPAAAASACARAGHRRNRPRHLSDHRHRNPLSGAEIAADRKDRRAAGGKKLPLLADVRDESAEDIRIVLEPKSRNVDPDAADGAAVPRRPSSRRASAQHECARRRGGARG